MSRKYKIIVGVISTVIVVIGAIVFLASNNQICACTSKEIAYYYDKLEIVTDTFPDLKDFKENNKSVAGSEIYFGTVNGESRFAFVTYGSGVYGYIEYYKVNNNQKAELVRKSTVISATDANREQQYVRDFTGSPSVKVWGN
jgi:hypothetical protein